MQTTVAGLIKFPIITTGWLNPNERKNNVSLLSITNNKNRLMLNHFVIY